MPLSSHHVNQATNNLTFLKTFYQGNKYNDWAITVSFYTALHVVESAISETKDFNISGKKITIKGIENLREQLVTNSIIKPTDQPSNHKLRAIVIQYGFSEIEGSYRELQNMAWSSRYVRFSWSQPQTFFAVEYYLKEILEWYNKKFKKVFDSNFKKVSSEEVPAKSTTH